MTDFTRKSGFFFTDLTRKIGVFRCFGVILQKFCPCKKMTNMRYAYKWYALLKEIQGWRPPTFCRREVQEEEVTPSEFRRQVQARSPSSPSSVIRLFKYYSAPQKWPNTSTNIIHLSKNDRRRIWILFDFLKMTEHK